LSSGSAKKSDHPQMKCPIASTLVVFILSGCGGATGDRTREVRHEPSDALKLVVAADGISRSEAAVIAWAYFHSNISECGGTGEPESKNEYWVTPVNFGYAGVPIEPIFIDKQSGAITWRDTTVTLAQLEKDVAPR
jgi:hypothetical protein